MTPADEFTHYARQGLITDAQADTARGYQTTDLRNAPLLDDAYAPPRITLSQAQWEEIIAHGAVKSSDLYCGAIGCIQEIVKKPDCTVDEIRTILAALGVVWDAHMAQLQAARVVAT
jgi:hypothetical protein